MAQNAYAVANQYPHEDLSMLIESTFNFSSESSDQRRSKNLAANHSQFGPWIQSKIKEKEVKDLTAHLALEICDDLRKMDIHSPESKPLQRAMVSMLKRKAVDATLFAEADLGNDASALPIRAPLSEPDIDSSSDSDYLELGEDEEDDYLDIGPELKKQIDESVTEASGQIGRESVIEELIAHLEKSIQIREESRRIEKELSPAKVEKPPQARLGLARRIGMFAYSLHS